MNKLTQALILWADRRRARNGYDAGGWACTVLIIVAFIVRSPGIVALAIMLTWFLFIVLSVRVVWKGRKQTFTREDIWPDS